MRYEVALLTNGKVPDEIIPSNIARVGSGGFLNVNTFTQSTPASTWSVNHSLNRIVLVNVFVDGVQVDADVTVTNTNISVSFPSPTIGKLTYI